MPGAWQALANMADEAHWDAAYRSKKPTEVSWYEASPITPEAHRSALFSIRSNHRCRRRGLAPGGRSPRCWLRAPHRAGRVSECPRYQQVASRSARRASRMDRWRHHHGCCVARRSTFGTIAPFCTFLTNQVDQRAYARLAARTVRAGGHLVAATFAPDGPQRCSGLPVQRHDGASVRRSSEMTSSCSKTPRDPPYARRGRAALLLDGSTPSLRIQRALRNFAIPGA